MRERKILNGNFDRDLTKIIPTSLEAENIAKEVEQKNFTQGYSNIFWTWSLQNFFSKSFQKCVSFFAIILSLESKKSNNTYKRAKVYVLIKKFFPLAFAEYPPTIW